VAASALAYPLYYYERNEEGKVRHYLRCTDVHASRTWRFGPESGVGPDRDPYASAIAYEP
jgi:hypothetical protein